ncbi:hypothetical protein [Mycobacterium sp. URHB0021]
MIAMFGVLWAPSVVASAEPTTPGNAQQTIGELKSEGYNVVIDRVGSGPLNDCTVIDVRNARTITQTIVTGHDTNRKVETVVLSKSITVSLNCDT